MRIPDTTLPSRRRGQRPVLARTIVPLLAGGSLLLLGCGGYTNKDLDLDSHPIVNTGVGGTILMPGDNGFPMPGASPRTGLGPPPPGGAASGSQSASGQGQAAPRGSGITMIGSTEQDIEQHRKVVNEPAWAKAAKLPFLIAAYPFKKAHQVLTGPPDPTVKVTGPPPAAPPTPAELQARRERALLEGMEKELSQRNGAAPAPSPYGATQAGATGPPHGAALGQGVAMPRAAAAPPSNAPRSIAQELAALRSAMQAGPPLAPAAATAPLPAGVASVTIPGTPAPAPPAPAPVRLYETLDRDGDGRPDRWVYRQGRQVVAEATDEDGDGIAERKVHFVPGSQVVAREEEDTDADGRADTFSEYEAGVIVERETDGNGDGEVDGWSYYEAGQLVRNERDTNADGFRDRMAFYEAGRLVREEEDRDGNGRPDRITHYDDQERKSRQEEDTDRDGVMDLRSFYQEGKLRRRELIR